MCQHGYLAHSVGEANALVERDYQLLNHWPLCLCDRFSLKSQKGKFLFNNTYVKIK